MAQCVIRDGDVITCAVRSVRIASSYAVFSQDLRRWGAEHYHYHRRLRDSFLTITVGQLKAQMEGAEPPFRQQIGAVVEVEATLGVWAALREDGSVATWGDSELGGDSSSVRSYEFLAATCHSFESNATLPNV